MKIFVLLALLGLHSAGAVTHSMKNFYTGSTGVPNFPEFVAVGLVNDVQIEHYDSNTKRKVPTQDWMKRVTEDDPQYWERNTENLRVNQQIFKASIEITKQRFNQTGGVHIFQWMYGCEWNDETGEVNGFTQYGYDGEDFISFDLKTESWIAPKQQGCITKQKWDREQGYNVNLRNFLNQTCVGYMKKFVNYGRSSLMRTAPPSVSLLQKTPSSPVSCLATGFYPDRAMMFWRKDGEELHEEHGEILPNHDGSFQMRVDLDISSVPAEKWGKYECVFQLSGVKDDIITKLDKAVIRSNQGSSGFPVGAVVGGVVVVLLLLITGVVIWKKIMMMMMMREKKDGFKPVTNPEKASTGFSNYSLESVDSKTSLTQGKN